MTIADGADIDIFGGKHLGGNTILMTGGTVNAGNETTRGGVQTNNFKITGGTLNLQFGAYAGNWKHSHVGGYHSFEVAGGVVNVGPGGRLWIGMEEDGSIKNDMVFSGGVVNLSGTGSNKAVISTMTNLSANAETGTPEQAVYQTLALRGTEVNVEGEAEFFSRDVRLESGSLNLDDGAKLSVFGHKVGQVAGNGEFTVDGGRLAIGAGSTLEVERSAFVLESGEVRTSELFVGEGTVDPAVGSRIVAKDGFELIGGTLYANKIEVQSGHEMGFDVADAELVLTGEGASFVNEGTLTLSGLTMAANGKTVSDVLGFDVGGSGTVALYSGNILSGSVDAEGVFSITAKSKDEVAASLKRSAYFDSAYAVLERGYAKGDMTAELLAAFDMLGEEAPDVAAFDAAVDETARRGLSVYGTAFDVMRLANEGVEARNMSAVNQEAGLWANAFYSTYDADEVLGAGRGYEADVYGGQIGADWTCPAGWRLGAAFTFATADSNTKGSLLRTDVDGDFFGFSVYTSKQFDRAAVGFDVGYMKGDNDLSTATDEGVYKDSSDTTVWTAGIRADIFAWSTDSFSVKPHFGIRYSRVEADSIGVVDMGNLNAVEMPVGVTFAGTFDAAGWKISPEVDVSVAPQLGDTDVDYAVLGAGTSSEVVDGSVFRTKIGATAEYGSFGLGVNYRYGTSSDERSEHSVNVNAVYRF